MTDPPALAVEDVVAGYGGVLALQGVSLSVPPGTITAVLGANGAGKTTLLNTISGFVRPRQVRITLEEGDLTCRPARAAPRDTRCAGRERRGQDHPAQHDLGVRPAATGPDHPGGGRPAPP